MKLSARELQTINDALVLSKRLLSDDVRRLRKAGLNSLAEQYKAAGERMTEVLRAINAMAKDSGIKLKDFDQFGMK